jgi:RND family efflux transporter MFP subunit
MNPRFPSSRAVGLVVVALLLAGVGYAVWAHSGPEVRTESVRRGKAVNAVTGSVTVAAEFVATVRASVPGRITQTALEVGSAVKAGDFLVQLDTVDLELEIASTEESLQTARRRVEVGSVTRIELENARVDLGNLERAVTMGTASSVDLDRSRRNVKAIEQRLALETLADEAAIAQLENALAVRRRQREKMTVTAPADGVISEVFARPGDLIGGESPIATLISTRRTVEAKISEENFSGIRIGQRASVRFLGYGDERFGAQVSKLLPTADAATQRYVAFLEVDVPAERLLPGLTGEVSVVVGERPQALIFPRRALFDGKVYVVRDGRVELRTVRTGFVSLNEVESRDGLAEGERVLVENLDQVRAGDRVRQATGSP